MGLTPSWKESQQNRIAIQTRTLALGEESCSPRPILDEPSCVVPMIHYGDIF